VGGRWVEPRSEGVLEVRNPATGELLAEAPDSGPEDVAYAVEAARAAQAPWARRTPRERAEVLLRLADAIDENADGLARCESRNVGKPTALTREELPEIADAFRFFAGAARTMQAPAPMEYLRGSTSVLRWRPLGVVAAIVPWNYPLWTAAWKIAPALAAGNAMVLKPADETPLTALRLAELAEAEGLDGVLNVVTGSGTGAGAALVRHPDVAMVSLTGAVETGVVVARAAAEGPKRVHLELGGKAPALVFDDADPAAAAAGIARAAFMNSGQDCLACSRVLAGPKVHDALVAGLVEHAGRLRVGDPSENNDIDMGPVISRQHQQKVLAFVEGAKNASVLIGGTALERPGFFVSPTVLVRVEQGDDIVQREVFGPVVTVQRFEDDAQAVAWANDVRYGLAASVWTRDLARALDVVAALEVGTVWVNDHLSLVNEMPHSGRKASGYGKDLSTLALEEYVAAQHVMLKGAPEAEG
jgi:1-pyrroline dehydrogenase